MPHVGHAAVASLARLFKSYNRQLAQRPFVTNVLTSTTFMTMGDLTSQCIANRRAPTPARQQPINLERTACFAIAGLLYVGPLVRGCLVMIDKLFGPTGKSLKTLAKKVALDQLIIAPCFLVGSISFLTALRHRGSLEAVRNELERSYLAILRMNYQFWPWVQLANFYFVPLSHRVLFGSSAALVWSTAMSYKLNSPRDANTR